MREEAPVTIDVFTLFPEMLVPAVGQSILGRACRAGLLSVRFIDIREYATDRYRQVDDAPYGGGPGMVMKAEPIFRAVEAAQEAEGGYDAVVLFSPRGRRFEQASAMRFSRLSRIALICGRYEGIDERVYRHLATEIVSIGDYVLTGGEPAALILVDAVARLIPGVLGKDESAESESFSESLVEYPHYTRPAEFRGWGVPEVLLGGNHQEVESWRRAESLRETLRLRPDLFRSHALSPLDQKLLNLTPPRRRRRKSSPTPPPESEPD